MKLDFEQGKIEAFEEGLKNFVDRNIYHARRAFELPEGEERNEQIVKLLNEATKGAVGDFRIKDGNIIDIDGNEISVVRTKFGLLEYLNKVTVLDDFTGEAANKAKTYVGRRNKELGYPTQKEFEAAYAALQVGQSTMGPDGKYYTKTK